MSLFALISLIVSISCALLALFTFLQARNQLHRIWGIFNANLSLWCLGLYFIGIAQSSSQALFYWKLTLVPNVFISVFFYHIVYSFCQLNQKRFLLFIYLQGVLFALAALFYKGFVTKLNLIFDTIYFAKATPAISFWLLIFTLITIIAFYRIWNFSRSISGEKKIQSLYLFWGMVVGFGGGFTVALPLYGISIYPGWHFLICAYTGIFTFSILRHQFLDIRVGLTRLLIPACIFTAVLFIFCFIYFDMNLFSMASLSVSILCALLAFIVFAYSTKKVHKIWAIFNVIIAAWGLTNFWGGMSVDPEKALVSWRLVCVVTTFLSVVYYHVIVEFCGIKRSRMLHFAYIQGILFVPIILFSKHFIGSTFYIFNSLHYYKATISFTIWALVWFIITGSAFVQLYKFIKRSRGIQKTQALYMFWAPLLGHTGGAMTIIPAFGIPLYPAWHFSVCVYAVIMTYAMFRYQLMDIKIAGTRLGIFILVYSLVLGIPIGIGFLAREYLENLGYHWWLIPTGLCAIFATVGPFIYLYFQRKAENKIMQEERQTQELLLQASYGINTIHDLDRLLNLIVDVVIKILRVNKVEIYLFDKNSDFYKKAVPKSSEVDQFFIKSNDPLIEFLKKTKAPIIYEEVKMKSQEERRTQFIMISKLIEKISVSVIVPIAIDNSMLGFIALGDRKSREMYSKDLLNTLTVLGNQAALAIENCHYLEIETKRMQEEGLRERMLALDHMASSMAHEIDNPMHAIRQSLGYISDFLLTDPRLGATDDLKNDFKESLTRSQQCAERVSSMIKAILDYSRMGTGELTLVKINDAFNDFLQLMQPQIKKEKVNFMTEIEDDLPLIFADKVQLEEIFMNFVRNSLHAVRSVEDKTIILKIFKHNNKHIRIECKDNGYGIAKDMLNSVFLSSTTTKGSSEGTGLGLYRVRKIVDLFKGKVWAESEGKGKGTTLIVELPACEADGNNNIN